MAESKNPWVYLLLMMVPLGIGAGCVYICGITGRLMIFGMVALIMLLPAAVCICEFIDALSSRRNDKKE